MSDQSANPPKPIDLGHGVTAEAVTVTTAAGLPDGTPPTPANVAAAEDAADATVPALPDTQPEPGEPLVLEPSDPPDSPESLRVETDDDVPC